MKFLNKTDINDYYLECNRPDLLDTGESNITEVLGDFIKSRNKYVPTFKDFRKSQMAKRQWRQNRFSMVKGMKKFHHSSKGKKFHRQLGRFLANRIFKKSILSENSGKEYIDLLTSISSMRTNLYIYSEYYRPMTEQIEFELWFEESINVLMGLEKSVIEGSPELSESDLDLLCRLIDEKILVDEITKVTGRDFETIFPLQYSEEFSIIDLKGDTRE